MCSCTVYVKDAFTGDPSGPTYREAYQNAVSTGATHESAHRQALLAASSRDTKVSERRQRDKEDDRKRKQNGEKTSSGLIDWRWD